MQDEPISISIEESIVPKIIFIIPYRNREAHLENFRNHMKMVMEDYPAGSYKYMIIHQQDTREFNRGAMKNIGFIVATKLYPNDYKNITFVFNDVDNMPARKNMLPYQTNANVIKHFYGYNYTLGGIISVLGRDFERIGGFPNFWGWGYEDNMLQQRAIAAGIVINRDVFFKINDTENIIHFEHGTERIMNKFDFEKYSKKTNEGLYTIYKMEYNIDNATDFVNVTDFKTGYEEVKQAKFVHDLRNGNRPLQYNRRNPRAPMQLGEQIYNQVHNVQTGATPALIQFSKPPRIRGNLQFF